MSMYFHTGTYDVQKITSVSDPLSAASLNSTLQNRLNLKSGTSISYCYSNVTCQCFMRSFPLICIYLLLLSIWFSMTTEDSSAFTVLEHLNDRTFCSLCKLTAGYVVLVYSTSMHTITEGNVRIYVDGNTCHKRNSTVSVHRRSRAFPGTVFWSGILTDREPIGEQCS